MTKMVNCYSGQLKPKTIKHSLNLRIFNLFLFAMIFSLGFFHLINISDLTVKGFVLQELKAQAASLAAEKVDNEQQVDALQSYYALNSRAQSLNMVKISDIEYLSISSHVVAKK
jgi:cell division protein FtsB